MVYKRNQSKGRASLKVYRPKKSVSLPKAARYIEPPSNNATRQSERAYQAEERRKFRRDYREWRQRKQGHKSAPA